MPLDLRGGKKAEASNPFARFKLRENPFVSAPVANYAATDPRLRKIFSREAQKTAIERIEGRWIGTKLFKERLRVGFLWAQSTDLTDKGMGKSAVVFNVIDRVNDGWGKHFFKDRKVAAIYVYAGTEWKEIGHVCIDAMRRLEETGIIDEVVKVMRYEVLAEASHPAVAGFTSEEELVNPLDEGYLTDHDVDSASLEDGVTRKLVDAGVTEPGLATAVAQRKYTDFLKSKRSDRQLTVPPKAHDWRLTKESFRLFFDQSMRIMAAGKFDACYLFLDDVENIIKHPKTNLRQFAAQLGGSLFRDDVFSNTDGFLSIFLTTHSQAAQMLAKEWRECGYQTRAELHTQSENSGDCSKEIGPSEATAARKLGVSSLPAAPRNPARCENFPRGQAAEKPWFPRETLASKPNFFATVSNSVMITRLTANGAAKMIEEYLGFYRSEPVTDPLFPFTADAVQLLAEKSQYHPAQLLRNCHKVLLQAVEAETDVISKDFAVGVLEAAVDAAALAGDVETSPSFGGFED